jgi:hypothetical protein
MAEKPRNPNFIPTHIYKELQELRSLKEQLAEAEKRTARENMENLTSKVNTLVGKLENLHEEVNLLKKRVETLEKLGDNNVLTVAKTPVRNPIASVSEISSSEKVEKKKKATKKYVKKKPVEPALVVALSPASSEPSPPKKKPSKSKRANKELKDLQIYDKTYKQQPKDRRKKKITSEDEEFDSSDC